MSTAVYRARSATELIDAAFQLIRRHATPLFTLAALFTIPTVILQWTVMGTSPLQAFSAAGQANMLAAGFGRTIVYFVVIVVWSALFHAAMFYAASDAFLGRPVVIADTLKRAIPKILPMIGAYFLMTILVSIGVIGLFVGAIFVALFLFAVPSVIAFEDAGVFQALGRSSVLSRGIKGHIFLSCLLAIALYMVGYIIVLMVSGAIGTFTHTPAVGTFLVALGAAVLVPILPVVFTLLYYDARIRKEGFDIQLMADQVAGGGVTPQPAV